MTTEEAKEALEAAFNTKNFGAALAAIQEGGDINYKDFAGRSMLSIFGADAALITNAEGARARVKQLFALGADPGLGGYALVDAAAYGMATAVEELLTGGVDPNFQQRVTNVSALHRAVKHGYVAIVKALLAAGARSDLVDERKKTARQIATGEILTLLDGGATVMPAAKKTAPKKTAPKKTAPKKTAPKKTAPKKTVATRRTPKPKKTAPKKRR